MDLKYPPGLSKYCSRINLLSVKEIGNELSLNLSNDQAGRLIGSGGRTIKDLRKRFDGVKIDINNFGQRVVKISGRDKVRVYGLILTQIL
jgi:predicted RNA-binding protein YlqC (UPF0109 family)